MAERQTTYWCVEGHPVPAPDLTTDTEIVVLDGGAEVRICRRHGCPIAIHLTPPAHATEEANAYLEARGGP